MTIHRAEPRGDRMKASALLGIVLLSLPGSLLAQEQRPIFSGTWTYQVPPSGGPRVGNLDGGGYTNWGPAAPLLIITQTAAQITLDRGRGETPWIYKLDGSEQVVPDPTNTEPGGPYPFKTRARWEGARLVLYTRQGLNQQRDILSLEGSVLRITRDTETPPGSGIDIRLVYRKASP
jgi:hypothetical protein